MALVIVFLYSFLKFIFEVWMRSEAFFNSFETDATDIISGNSPIGQLENFCWDFIQFVVWDIDTLQVGESWKFRHPHMYKNLLSKASVDSMILKISWTADSCRPGTVWFWSGMVLSCQINYQKFGESMFGEITTKKNSFHVQLFIGLIPSHKESPDFWHVISQLRTTLHWNHIVYVT